MGWYAFMLALGASIPTTTARMSCVNPSGRLTGQGSLRNNLVYMEHAPLTVRWTGTSVDEPATVVLWQVNTTIAETSINSDDTDLGAFGDLEYIALGVHWNWSEAPWTVVTRKDLTVSNVFCMSLYVSNHSKAVDSSVYFNILSPTTSRTASSVPATSSTSSSAAAEYTSATGDSSESGTSDADAGLGTATKVGIGVGVAVALLLGIAAAGWFFMRRKRKMSRSPREDTIPAAETNTVVTSPRLQARTHHELGGGHWQRHGVTPVEMDTSYSHSY